MPWPLVAKSSNSLPVGASTQKLPGQPLKLPAGPTFGNTFGPDSPANTAARCYELRKYSMSLTLKAWQERHPEASVLPAKPGQVTGGMWAGGNPEAMRELRQLSDFTVVSSGIRKHSRGGDSAFDTFWLLKPKAAAKYGGAIPVAELDLPRREESAVMREVDNLLEAPSQKFVVWLKDGGKWVEQGDGELTLKTAERIVRELRHDFGGTYKILPAGQTPATPKDESVDTLLEAPKGVLESSVFQASTNKVDYPTAEEAIAEIERAGKGRVVRFYLEQNLPGRLPAVEHRSTGMWSYDGKEWHAHDIHSGHGYAYAVEKPH